MEVLYECHGIEQERKVKQGKARRGKAREKGRRMKENGQMRGTQARPCLSKWDISKAACILGNLKLLAADTQDVLTPIPLAALLQSFTRLLLIVMVGDKEN